MTEIVQISEDQLALATKKLSVELQKYKGLVTVGIGENSLKAYIAHWKFKKIIPDSIDGINIETIVTGIIRPL